MNLGLSRNDAEASDTPALAPAISVPLAAPGTVEGAFASAAGGARVAGGIVAETRRHLNVTQRTLARMVGFSERSVAQWESQGLPASTQQDRSRRFVEMRRLFDALRRVLPKDQIGHWLDRPNDEFDGATPLQIIENGQIDRIYTLIFYAESGTPG